MTNRPKVRGDKLVLATISVLRTLIFELDKAGAIQLNAVLGAIDDMVDTHRQNGDPNRLADAIEMIAQHLRDSIVSGTARDH